MFDSSVLVLAGVILLKWLAGALGPDLRPKSRRRRTHVRLARLVTPPRSAGADPAQFASDQLAKVMKASFHAKRLMSASEARLFMAVEREVKARGLSWRVMAQVSLGEVVRTPDHEAFRAVNSKRVDLLVIAHDGQPLAAIEFQGSGHHQSAAAARDAVKREALRRAGIAFIEIGDTHGPEDLAREIDRLAITAASHRAA